MSFGEWADFFLESYSKPPLRAESTHEINMRVTKHLKPIFGTSKLVDITADNRRANEMSLNLGTGQP